MKTITKLSYALFLSLSFALFSCSGDDDNGSTNNNNNNNNNNSSEYVKAKVDGQNFSSSTTIDAVAASNPTANVLTVQGSDNSGKYIHIMLMSYNGEGTYDVSNQLNGNITYGTISPIASYSSAAGGGATGEVVITSVSATKVEGTFTFTGRKMEEGSTETVTVTQGEFKANIQ